MCSLIYRYFIFDAKNHDNETIPNYKYQCIRCKEKSRKNQFISGKFKIYFFFVILIIFVLKKL
jgi:hypothetical protein